MADDHACMDMEERSVWRDLVPEVEEWSGGAALRGRQPLRRNLLAVLEERTALFDRDLTERFVAAVSHLSFHDLPAVDIELVLRIHLQLIEGRFGDLELGRDGIRLLRAAERKPEVSSTYLDPFRAVVEAENA